MSLLRPLSRVLPLVRPRPSMFQSRGFHMDTHTHKNITEIFSDTMLSGGPHQPYPSAERIGAFMNTVYMHQPRAVTQFVLNYRTNVAERIAIKGLRIGPKHRGPHKNVVIVSGLPLQDPSVISVNLYVAAILSRMSPMLPYDVSIVPLAHPKEYEKWWKGTEVKKSLSKWREEAMSGLSEDSSSISSSFSSISIASEEEQLLAGPQDTCNILSAYVTRQNKFYTAVEVDLHAQGSSMKHKDTSLPNWAAKGKHGRFLLAQQEERKQQKRQQLNEEEFGSSPVVSIRESPLLAPFLQAQSYVLELRSTQALDDEQVMNRGEEVIAIVKKILECE